MTTDHPADGPPRYQLLGQDRIDDWRVVEHEEWLDFEVAFWVGGLQYDPWQEPSVQSSPAVPGRDEVRRAVVPGTFVGVSYVVSPAAKTVWLVAVADLP